MFTPVIMAGGAGTRLWPYSRKHYPKQFLPCIGEQSMLQQTLLRLKGLKTNPPIIICSEDHRFIVGEQLQQIGINNARILLEPEGRNTAPALASAALLQKNSDEILLALAADHFIADEAAFRKAVVQASELASQGHLVTFGIEPNKPETGYGYIKKGQSMEPFCSLSRLVDRFVEKPNKTTAQEYLDSGNYCWNSGMFMFRADVFLKELKSFRLDIYSACAQAVKDSQQEWDFTRLGKQAFLECPSESVDYAVMEQTQKAVVLPVSCGWNDVGSWSSILEIEESDSNGMVCHGDVQSVDSRNSYVRAESRLVSLVGVENLIVVETSDAVMVADRNQAQSVKRIVEALDQNSRSEAVTHRNVYRPWGSYDAIDEGHRYQVKRISVKPGARLSLQKHHHRAEHWIVVQGTALVARNDEELLLTENESVYIPVGCKHRLENPGKVTLELIEVQSGAYLGEDDIVRFEDTYGRVESGRAESDRIESTRVENVRIDSARTENSKVK
ncbi:mannose-1-phosphate guanylyltransferase/mannose-6-phosphate isomerase [Endozoicomonas sp. OPT23]|uniref:mannose-1-phosphate guanylyltransferase/mannose-6-phosphate isomerase n=1 Tax=Endozoicomonas sp. OPT23 TaxID=2072845 RepID=UPI00129B41AF|nr:mannose-1-phosphate guanylyltransferase/mannose-6-phosphate isomerase [Endozoicomonas sp. OPT23]MRI32075.1 mannose-1-phosphate guanylyltransferase/mannose-6-phosphate isomerase [Endozoicomonas sp. OPT23]